MGHIRRQPDSILSSLLRHGSQRDAFGFGFEDAHSFKVNEEQVVALPGL